MDARMEPSLVHMTPAPALAQGCFGDRDSLPECSAREPKSRCGSDPNADTRSNKNKIAKKVSTRECLATGETLPKAAMIRFVVGPDGALVVDLAGKLPGRGLWVKAERSALDRALSRNLFAKAAKTRVKISAKSLETIANLQRKRCLELLGIAKGAGEAVLGEQQVESALRHEKLAFLVVADDAGKSAISELSKNALPNADDSPRLLTVNRMLNRAELGSAFGYAQIVYAGIKKGKLAEKIVPEFARLEKIVEMPHNSTEASSV